VSVGNESLYTNSTGSYNTALGRQALLSNTTASSNTAVGYRAVYSNQTGQGITAVGQDALYSNTVSNNTAVGIGSLYANTTGTFNVALGASLFGGAAGALGNNTTGSYNTAIGARTLQAQTTPSYNTAVGYGVGYAITTGNSNTLMGGNAAGSLTTGNYNNAFGNNALTTATTGSGNVAIGEGALYAVTTGTTNTAVGSFDGTRNASGRFLTTGSYNTFIGTGAGADITTGSKNSVLGGYSGNQGGLDIRTASNYIVLSDGDGNAPAVWDGSTFWAFGSSRRVRIANAYIGDANIGGNNSGWAFGAGGILPADGSGNVTDNVLSLGSGANRMATIYAGNGTINTSDANTKQDIADLDDAEKQVAIRIKSLIKKFRFKDAVAEKGDAARIHVGVIAQEVQAAFVAEGLDATRYGLFCSDTWYEVNGQSIDEDKRPYSADTPNAVEKTRLGVRYEQLLAFVIAAL
jgi:hypothetical protein